MTNDHVNEEPQVEDVETSETTEETTEEQTEWSGEFTPIVHDYPKRRPFERKLPLIASFGTHGLP